MPEVKKERRESRLINEWMAEYHLGVPQWKHPRVGPYPGREPEKLKGVKRGWVDIIFKENNIIYLVEAKMRPTAAAAGQLLEYARLFPLTPEFSEFKDLPIRMIFLTTSEDEITRATCESLDVEYVVFRPPWVEQYFRELAARGQ